MGPLLPKGFGGHSLARVVAQQDTICYTVGQTWPTRNLRQFDIHDEGLGLAALGSIGAQLDPEEAHPPTAPIAESWQGAPAVAIELPGLPAKALQITLSGDELIVRVGPYRRHILPPDGLRGVTNIKATREGERLIIRRRQ